jgi:hypothetical protein
MIPLETHTMSTKPLPIPMFLTCPRCCARHIDEGEFETKSHAVHSCQICGLTWRPAVEPTVGVMYLPGFKNDSDPPTACTPRRTWVMRAIGAVAAATRSGAVVQEFFDPLEEPLLARLRRALGLAATAGPSELEQEARRFRMLAAERERDRQVTVALEEGYAARLDAALHLASLHDGLWLALAYRLAKGEASPSSAIDILEGTGVQTVIRGPNMLDRLDALRRKQEHRDVITHLRAARARIIDSRAWCRGELALDARGEIVEPHDPRAVAWSMLGALGADGANTSAFAPDRRRECDYLKQALRARGFTAQADPLSTFNDDPATRHVDVISIYDAAIAMAER